MFSSYSTSCKMVYIYIYIYVYMNYLLFVVLGHKCCRTVQSNHVRSCPVRQLYTVKLPYGTIHFPFGTPETLSRKPEKY